MPKKDIGYRKRILSLLKQDQYSLAELERITKTPGARTRKMTILRILKEYKEIGLVDKNERDKWYWLERKTPSDFEQVRSLGHSQELVSGLEAIRTEPLQSNEQTTEQEILKEAAEEHLKTGYTKIYSLLLEYRKLDQESERLWSKAAQNFSKAKLLTPDKFHVLYYQKREGKGLLGKVFPQRRLMRREVPLAYRFKSLEEAQQTLKDTKISATGILTLQSGEAIVLGPLYIEDDDPEKFDKIVNLHGELEKEIFVLIMRIKSGQILEGKCKLCREFVSS